MTKVVLLKDVKDVGRADTLTDVSEGYARNFLLPKKLAVLATEPAILALEGRKRTADEKRQKEKDALKAIASRIDGVELDISVDAGDSGKLFGSVTSIEIAHKVQEKLGIEIDRKKIVLDEHIKATGMFNVPVRFASDITAILKVKISAAAKA